MAKIRGNRAPERPARLHDIATIARRWATEAGPFPESTIRAMIADGRLPGKKYGRRWMVRDDDLLAFEAGDVTGRRQPQPQPDQAAVAACPAASRHGL